MIHIDHTLLLLLTDKFHSYGIPGIRASNQPSLMNVMMELRKCCNHPYLLRFGKRQTDRQTDGRRDRQADRKTQTDRQTDRYTGRQTDRQTDRQKDRQAFRRTDR